MPKLRWETVQGKSKYRYYYWLSPTRNEVFELALEGWAIWIRWRSALKPGRPDSFMVVGQFGAKGVHWGLPGA